VASDVMAVSAAIVIEAKQDTFLEPMKCQARFLVFGFWFSVKSAVSMSILVCDSQRS
jgi:hypothetical protein